jgi:5'-nucleotidase
MAKPTLDGKLVVAISSRALFDLTESHRIYTAEGVDAYHRYQVQHEDEMLAPGRRSSSSRSCCASIARTSSTSR